MISTAQTTNVKDLPAAFLKTDLQNLVNQAANAVGTSLEYLRMADHAENAETFETLVQQIQHIYTQALQDQAAAFSEVIVVINALQQLMQTTNKIEHGPDQAKFNKVMEAYSQLILGNQLLNQIYDKFQAAQDNNVKLARMAQGFLRSCAQL